MKKWGFLICIIAIGYIFSRSTAWFQEQTEPMVEIKYTNEIHAGHAHTIHIDMKSEVHKGNLLLVNSEYPVHPAGVRADIVNLAEQNELVRGYGLMNQKIRLSRYVAQAFEQMVEAAGQDDVRYFMISSGYRDLAEQEQLYAQKGLDYALPPGHSEHNLGLSVDVGSTLAAMSEAPEGAWLERNAWKYGFILRYPKDKVHITGIQYEPWHFRYVGLPHSAVMVQRNLALEQYLELLKDKKSLTVDVEGQTYHVHYYTASREQAVYIPENRSYEISGDNMDGVVVTVKE
ncbi:M15 family metallopeptidase [Paenibacillus sp. MER 99-2]|uniref:M15 family metallopeptidase n=1 Tax=Paenibacillus sp. MER 99-2 TaxID=2939572 RepID=UPI00203B3EB4|nr:M15 family metallopeptidase [Paenibacillus sp. MER 99-2]MCM3175789.1 M15 family metallopeptidase [Paenibacillus sp. MER 99-2]